VSIFDWIFNAIFLLGIVFVLIPLVVFMVVRVATFTYLQARHRFTKDFNQKERNDTNGTRR